MAATLLRPSQVRGAFTTLTDGATVTMDLNVTRAAKVTLGGNRTLALSNDRDGDSFVLVIRQDATGSRTVTWWSGILWQNGNTPVLTTTPNKYDVFSFMRLSSGVYLGTSALNF